VRSRQKLGTYKKEYISGGLKTRRGGLGKSWGFFTTKKTKKGKSKRKA